MSHTIKISGVSEELLSRVDEKWKAQHYADRSEYVRDLIRRDVLTPPTLAEGMTALFRAVREETVRLGYSDDDIAADVAEAVREVRKGRRPANSG